MAHPHEKSVKAHRHSKHAKLGVKGEHPDHKAERLCNGGYAHGGGVKEAHFPGAKKIARSHEPNPDHSI
jgi:hypothetical protein